MTDACLYPTHSYDRKMSHFFRTSTEFSAFSVTFKFTMDMEPDISVYMLYYKLHNCTGKIDVINISSRVFMLATKMETTTELVPSFVYLPSVRWMSTLTPTLKWLISIVNSCINNRPQDKRS